MKYKKGDLVKVIEVEDGDSCSGVKLNETYKVVNLFDGNVYINAGLGNRVMWTHQLKKVKKKSKKDLRIEELENQIHLLKLLNK